MIYLLFNIYNIVTNACMSYFKCSNCVKEVLTLEQAGVTCVFPEPGFALAISIVNIHNTSS